MAEENKTTQRKIKPDLPGGFRDYGFSDIVAKQNILDLFRKTAELFGFEPLETSSVQKTEVLTGGEETASKIIFNVKSSRDESEETADQSGTSLRFDLTVPLARFLASNPDVSKPFRRYEIGKVWRGERQRAGRYREFTQADADIVGTPLLEADAEIILFMYRTLTGLGLDNFKIKVNFKDEALALQEKYGIKDNLRVATLIEVDKKEKLEPQEWKDNILRVSGMDKQTTEEYIKALSAKPKAGSKYEELKKKLVAGGFDEKKLEYDGSIVRGLAYYTGTVFETVLEDCPEMGSVFSGGRYDGLIESFTGQKIPAVGTSLGVDRLLAALEKTGKLPQEKTKTRVLVMNLPETADETPTIVQSLREAGVNTSLYLGKDDTMQAQLAYALKKEIPFVVIYGPEEKKKGMVAIKNLQTREQKEVAKDKVVEYFRQ